MLPLRQVKTKIGIRLKPYVKQSIVIKKNLPNDVGWYEIKKRVTNQFIIKQIIVNYYLSFKCTLKCNATL